MRPLINLPAFVVAGESFEAWALAPPSQTGFSAVLELGANTHPLAVEGVSYDSSRERWSLTLRVPAWIPEELYTLVLSAPGLVSDRSVNSVKVLDSEPTDYYFVQISDTHLITHLYWDQPGADTDTSEVADFRALIDDINMIQPAFVLHTGDLINEGELEEFLDKYYWSRTQSIFGSLQVPLFLVSGNHDIGGWSATPPSDGTARRNWWRYFGWPWLDNPPAGDPYTQNYSFELGQVHYVGLESYVNYDYWRHSIYGDRSFTAGQLAWLAQDLAQAPANAANVVFYHHDFEDQIDVPAMGIDMALWGHWHGVPEGNWQTPPFDLGLQCACDGNRMFRLVRVSGSTLAPRPMLSAGLGIDNLTLQYETLGDSIRATIVNLHPEPFENAQVRFRVPDDGTQYQVQGGTVKRILQDGPDRVFYVSLPVAASGTSVATLVPASTSDAGIVPARQPVLGPAFPNPFNPSTTIRTLLPRPGHVRIVVHDVVGRHVRTLRDGDAPAGAGTVTWDGRDDSGRDMPSGSYWVRMTGTAGEHQTRVVLVH
jgi:predicted MPP superfamily phosphohydrolase